jgi:hypothetical protein
MKADMWMEKRLSITYRYQESQPTLSIVLRDNDTTALK